MKYKINTGNTKGCKNIHVEIDNVWYNIENVKCDKCKGTGVVLFNFLWHKDVRKKCNRCNGKGSYTKILTQDTEHELLFNPCKMLKNNYKKYYADGTESFIDNEW
jgi:excinuclease UvrABC ATPase subunit